MNRTSLNWMSSIVEDNKKNKVVEIHKPLCVDNGRVVCEIISDDVKTTQVLSRERYVMLRTNQRNTNALIY